MIGSIYMSMFGGSVLRGPESSARSISANASDSPKATKPAADARSRTSDFAGEGEKAGESGYGSEETPPLFAEINQTELTEKMSQLIVQQRSYEADLKIFQAEDAITRETLSILV
jgi:flagellar hook protein FlgE